MTKVVFIERNGMPKEVSAQDGTTLLQVAHANGIDMEGACEGAMACSTCAMKEHPPIWVPSTNLGRIRRYSGISPAMIRPELKTASTSLFFGPNVAWVRRRAASVAVTPVSETAGAAAGALKELEPEPWMKVPRTSPAGYFAVSMPTKMLPDFSAASSASLE